MQELAGKRAIVTAGASGIGRVTARTLAAAGAKVAICDIDQARLAEFRQREPGILALECDVARPDAIDAPFAAMLKHLGGGLDILVNNAGIAGPTAGVADVSPEAWDKTLAINLSASFYWTSLAVPHLRQAGGGSIVNMSSVAGRLGFPNRAPYAAAKWGIIGLTQSLAMELGQDKIRVNAILPGSVTGDRMDAVMANRAKLLGISREQALADEVQVISLKQMIDPQEIADMILFVCSDRGRSISGQSLGVCGNTEILR